MTHPVLRASARALAAATVPLSVLTPAAHAAHPTSSTAPAAARVRLVNAPGTTINQTMSQQVMVADRTRGTRGTWARWSWNGSRWVRVNAPATAIFGKRGVVPAGRRVQGSNQTPAGQFPVLTAFGVGNPGTRMPYRRITGCSWWISDPGQRDYNRWRESCAVRGRVAANSEHMASYARKGLYTQGAVIGYNYTRPVRRGAGSGSGIFLHYARSYTGGCVGLTSMAELRATIAWLDPAKRPMIAIKA